LAAYDEEEGMLKQLSVKSAPITNRATDYAAMAPACCNACRTCAMTNILGLAIASFAGTSALIGRLIVGHRR
jgi:hypothetical protein